MIRFVLRLLVGLAMLTGVARAEVTVFAAASLKGGLDEAAVAWTAETGVDVRLSFAGSSALARQILQGAPADIFISASSEWMDMVEGYDALVPDTRKDLLANRLVLIGASNTSAQALSRDADLLAMLGDGKLAMALVEAVPAGIYGKAALEWFGLWDGVKDHVAQADNVRAALALVAWGEAPLGVVYKTDATAEPRVAIIATFPTASHPPIVYPAARLRGAGAAATDFLEYLSTPRGAAFFAARGFLAPE